MTKALFINSSGRHEGSATRQTLSRLEEELAQTFPDLTSNHRNLGTSMPFVDEEWIAGNFNEPELRTTSQRMALSQSDELIRELMDTDVLVLGVPIYNFNIPAALKAWIDQVCRARVTFKYTEQGPVGLLKGRKVYVIMASGGVPIGSPMDHASPYLKQVLGFIGLDDVTVIDANQASQNTETKLLNPVKKLEKTA